jgi:hypothetical protein
MRKPQKKRKCVECGHWQVPTNKNSWQRVYDNGYKDHTMQCNKCNGLSCIGGKVDKEDGNSV